MNPQNKYRKQLEFINHVIQNKVDGLTHADSMIQPPFPGNCMNWNIGHILVYRHQMLGEIDGQSEADEDEFAIYGAGSEPLTDSQKAMPLDQLMTRLQGISKRLGEALNELTAEELAKVVNEERGLTLDERLNFYLMFHESYHTGQLELLREMALAQ